MNITQSFLLQNEHPFECTACQEEEYTIKHILNDCNDIVPIHQQFYGMTSLEDLFEKIKKGRDCPGRKVNQFHKL